MAKARVGDRLWIAGYESKEGIERLLGMGLPAFLTKIFCSAITLVWSNLSRIRVSTVCSFFQADLSRVKRL
ncbi:MAG: hypothetical protein AB4368_29395, partial [Xenococcaceae cyanobacterium]